MVYAYNADGIRTRKTVNGVTTSYTLEGDNVVYETNGTDKIWYYYDASGTPVSFELNGTSYHYVKNLQGDIIAIVNDSGTKVVEYTYNSWGKLISTTGSLASTVGVKNPYRYRSYRYDTETGLYYLQSRYYDPEIGRFINADSYVDTGDTVLSTNMFAYCENNVIYSIDPDGTRTYFLNGINNSYADGIPTYAKNFQKELSSVKDVRIIALFKGKSGFVGTVKGGAKVCLEMFNVNVYTNYVISIIKDDLKKQPLSKGEQLNLIGYSGGGQIALNVMTKMKNQITNVVLIGAPVCKSWKSTTKVSALYASKDPLSWSVGWGFKSYYAGRFGHTDYFNKNNIKNVASIVKKIIK